MKRNPNQSPHYFEPQESKVEQTSRLHRFTASFANLFRKLAARRFTIMLVPHADRKVISLQVNALVLAVAGLVVALLFLAFFYLATSYSDAGQENLQKALSIESTQSNLDTVLSQVKELMKTYQSFQSTMSGTLRELNINPLESETQAMASGDLANVTNTQELAENEVREVLDIKRLSKSLSDAIAPLNEISHVLKNQKQLLSDIPNLWPVAGGRSAITVPFGPTRDPFTDKWYVHKGIDISGPLGIPVVASANGKVIEAAYDADTGYGAYIIVEHKYGFRTRYSHLDTFFVRPGDEVYQGQRIGTLGNTGVSTGPHLEFQIMLGTQILDPASFLKLDAGSDRNQGRS